MTSFGRGRGWSTNQKDQSLHRPGGGGICANGIVGDIIDKITTYDIREYISPELIQEIVDLITSTVNKENLKDTCDTLWKQAILHNSFTTRIALIFSDNKIALIEDNNKETIRSRFLRFLQDNYMFRDKNKVEDRKIFMNTVLLHAEVYYQMRLSDGNRLKILAEPLIHYLEDLLQDTSNANVHFIMIQILRSGKDLCAACPERLKSLMMIIRQMLIKENNYTSQNRAALLLMVELANNSYEIRNIQLKEFYLSNIQSIPFEYLFSQEELKVITETTIKNDNQLQEVDNNQRIIKQGIKNDIPEQSNHSKGPNVVPRAIRGAGAIDIKKDDIINTKLHSTKIAAKVAPRQKNNKGWDHDDRFHKDYE